MIQIDSIRFAYCNDIVVFGGLEGLPVRAGLRIHLRNRQEQAAYAREVGKRKREEKEQIEKDGVRYYLAGKAKVNSENEEFTFLGKNPQPNIIHAHDQRTHPPL